MYLEKITFYIKRVQAELSASTSRTISAHDNLYIIVKSIHRPKTSYKLLVKM